MKPIRFPSRTAVTTTLDLAAIGAIALGAAQFHPGAGLITGGIGWLLASYALGDGT